MSAPGGSLFLAFALYCSHTAKTYTRLKSLIIQSMEITNARSHIVFYWPLKSNLGTAIKAETLLPLTLLSPTALGLGTLEHLLDCRAFLPDTWQMEWYLPKGPLIFTWSLWKSSMVNISSEIANSHVPAPEGWCARALFRPMAELNSKVSLEFIFFQWTWVYVRGESKASSRTSSLFPWLYWLVLLGQIMQVSPLVALSSSWGITQALECCTYSHGLDTYCLVFEWTCIFLNVTSLAQYSWLILKDTSDQTAERFLLFRGLFCLVMAVQWRMKKAFVFQFEVANGFQSYLLL